nr:hypothetical protein [uncultured Roseococcus sp.]
MDPIRPAGAALAPRTQILPHPPPAEVPPRAAAAPPMPNPTLRLDASLGMVVMEFRNGSEQVARSLPSEVELKAYRLAQRIGLEAEAAKPLRR